MTRTKSLTDSLLDFSYFHKTFSRQTNRNMYQYRAGQIEFKNSMICKTIVLSILWARRAVFYVFSDCMRILDINDVVWICIYTQRKLSEVGIQESPCRLLVGRSKPLLIGFQWTLVRLIFTKVRWSWHDFCASLVTVHRCLTFLKFVTSWRHFDDVVSYWFSAQTMLGSPFFVFDTGSRLWNRTHGLFRFIYLMTLFLV